MKTKVESPQKFVTSDERVIYAICIEVFPGFYGNVYVIDGGAALTLVDTGSGMDTCNEALIAGFASLDSAFGRKLSLADIEAVIVTHGHMDHFGGLAFVREHTNAPIGVHALDRRILSHYEERVIVASQRLATYLETCGLSEDARERLLEMYLAPKIRYSSMPVDFLLNEGQPVIAACTSGDIDLGLEVIHVPGHSPGLVCLRVDDLLLTADHVLSRITPHQAPESITLNMGLSHYFDSLLKIETITGIRLGLGGHEAPIEDVNQRAAEIAASHHKRLEQVFDSCAKPKSISEVGKDLFGSLKGYNVLLGLEEAGAHVEYLYQHGQLVAGNLEQIEQGERSVRYHQAI